MKKIAFLTSYYVNNYGTILQAFATQKILEQLGYSPELISVEGFWKEIRRRRARYFLRQALTSTMGIHKAGVFANKVIKKTGIGSYAKSAKERDALLDGFRKRQFLFSPGYHSLKELENEISKRYDAVIVGSDQLWLPGNIVGDFYTLSFVPDDIKKISYSTSFGQSALPNDIKDKTKSFLNRIDYLSVREQSGQRIIEELTGREAQVVLDPVLLFGEDFWRGYTGKDALINGEYIFCYFLGKKREGRQFAVEVKAQSSCKIVCLPCLDEYLPGDYNYSDIQLYKIDPFEFLNLLYHAKYVVTDSFHCIAFSLLFHKTFFAFPRYSEKTIYSTNNRLSNLLAMAGLQSRMVSGNPLDMQMGNVSFSEADARIANMKANSLSFLKGALDGK